MRGAPSRNGTSRTRRASAPSSTTSAATRTTTSSPRSSSRFAPRIRTRRSTTSQPCSRAGRIRYIARRLIVHASEDIGMADSRALLVAVAAAHAVDHVGLPERGSTSRTRPSTWRAPKSNAVIKAIGAASRDVREHGDPSTEGPARHALPGRQTRPRSRLHLSAQRSERLRGRQPAGRAQGQHVLRAVGRGEETLER